MADGRTLLCKTDFARRFRSAGPYLLVSALLLIVLLAAQLTLGVLTVMLRKPADVVSAHVAVGALVLVTSFVLTVRAARLCAPRRPGIEPTAAGHLDGDQRDDTPSSDSP